MTERFQKAYNSLVNAYFNGTLEAGDCTDCAVGNIVWDAQGLGDRLKKVGYNCSMPKEFLRWNRLFITVNGIQHRMIETESIEIADRLFEYTGYTADEMKQVEYAFEVNTKIKNNGFEVYGSGHTEQEILEDQFNGLSAVVDVLLELDGVEHNSVYAAKFREHPKLQKA